MPNKKSAADQKNSALQFLRGGKGVSENVVRRHMADLLKKKKAQSERTNTTAQQMAKYFSEIQKSAKPGAAEVQTSKALDGLLGLHKKLATQKLASPIIVGQWGGILPGRISVKVTPPFDYDVILPTVLAGNQPTLNGSADKNSGQMSASCATATGPGFNGGSMYTTVGIYFHPVTAGTLTVHATPVYSFEWWTNSLASYDSVRSFGSGALTVYGVDVASQTTGGTGGIVTAASQQFYSWEQDSTAQILFDLGSNLQTPVSVQVEADPSLVYLLFIEADTHVEGAGWPGSLAGSVLSIGVPFITYDFQIREVLEP